MRATTLRLALAAALLLVCVGLAIAALQVGSVWAVVVALIACGIAFDQLLRADDAVQDELDMQALNELEGHLMD
jgi:hypothetical protein